MADLILLNKPFNVLSQFSSSDEKTTLTDVFGQRRPGRDFYPAGRLDYDSEGLLLLTNDGSLQHRICHPNQKLPKTYWVQVEGQADQQALAQLQDGVELKDGRTRPAMVSIIQPDDLWPRNPPIRERQSVPTQWLELTITEGRNRQVRRMTAAVGLPTLRLIRMAIGHWRLDGLQPGEFRMDKVHLPTTPSAAEHHRLKNNRKKTPRPSRR